MLIGEENLTTTSQLWEPLSNRVSDIQVRLEEELSIQEDAATIQSSLLPLSESIEITVKFLTQFLGELSQGVIEETSNNEIGLLVELQIVAAQKIEEEILLLTRNYFRGLDIQNEVELLTGALGSLDKAIAVMGSGGDLERLFGEKTPFPVLTSEQNLSTLSEIKSVFIPLKLDIQNLLAAVNANGSRSTIPSLFVDALTYAQSNANELAGQMEELDTKAINLVEGASNTNRYIQIGGAVVSTLIFLFILGDFFGNLRRSDAEIEVAQRESQQIFETVDQGLFLLNNKIKIGGQYSKELENIFGIKDVANKDLLKFLEKTVSKTDLEQLTRYLKLLFDPKKKEKLILGLNPLQQIAIQVHEHGRVSDKFLRFGFSRVLKEGTKKVESILTSVSDITREALLQKQLDKASKTNDQQVALLTTLLNTNTDLIPIFLRNSTIAYDSINEVMREDSKSSDEYKEKANQLGILIHKVKGESAALSIDMVAESCEEFEDILEKIHKSHQVDGNSFLPLVVILQNLINYNNLIDDMNEKIFSKKLSSQQSGAGDKTQNIDINKSKKTGFDSSYLFEYVDKIAARLNKKVNFRVSGLDAPNLPQPLVDALPTFSSQFIRNSIAHGIEASSERTRLGKPNVGKVNMSLVKTLRGYELEIFDDGKGVDDEFVAARALKLGIITDKELSKLSQEQIKALLFKPGFSSKDDVDEDSGRGMGMSAISSLVNELKGKMLISTKVGAYTRFVVRFPLNVTQKKPV